MINQDAILNYFDNSLISIDIASFKKSDFNISILNDYKQALSSLENISIATSTPRKQKLKETNDNQYLYYTVVLALLIVGALIFGNKKVDNKKTN